MKLGVHVFLSEGIPKALERAGEIGCETIQIFSRSPRSLRGSGIQPQNISLIRDTLRNKGISPLVVHIPYLVNLASPKENLYELSVQAVACDLMRSGELDASYLVIHPGSHMGEGSRHGIERIAQALRSAMELAGIKGQKVQVLLETVSGAGSEVGSRFEELRAIMDAVGREGEATGGVGVCLDTCHVFAAGYDVSNAGGLRRTLGNFDEIIGLDRLKVIHANDSLGAPGSKLDRHAHIGEGHIGIEGFRAIVNCPELAGLPVVLETPHKSTEDDRRNLEVLRYLSRSS